MVLTDHLTPKPPGTNLSPLSHPNTILLNHSVILNDVHFPLAMSKVSTSLTAGVFLMITCLETLFLNWGGHTGFPMS